MLSSPATTRTLGVGPREDLVDRLVVRIETLQSRGSKEYGEGIWPSQRTHAYLPYAVEDETIFFTAATLYTLEAIRDAMSRQCADVLDAISRRSEPAFPRFRNRQGLPMYNYWQVHPEDRIFPNGRFLSRFRKFRLPEDIDTTAYVYLAGQGDESEAVWFQKRLQMHANGSQRMVRNTFRRYRNLRAHSTWMGDDNMPVDFDACAISNTLLALSKFGLPYSECDLDSFRYVESVILRDEYIDHPFRTAHWYASAPVIAYHVARLLARAEVPRKGRLKKKLARDVARLWRNGRITLMDRVVLSTASMWLGTGPRLAEIPHNIDGEIERYAFFVASFLAVPENAAARMLAPLKLFQLEYRCLAHSLALIVEHEVLKGRCAA